MSVNHPAPECKSWPKEMKTVKTEYVVQFNNPISGWVPVTKYKTLKTAKKHAAITLFGGRVLKTTVTEEVVK
jgi:hypothetical protein